MGRQEHEHDVHVHGGIEHHGIVHAHVRHDVTHRYPNELTEQLDRIEAKLGDIQRTEAENMSKWDDTLAKVTNLEDQDAAVVALLNGVAQEVRDLKAQIAAGSPVTEAQLDELSARLDADAQKAVDAVNANTDVAP